MSDAVQGWRRLLTITDAEILKANEDTLDELYAILLTTRIDGSDVSDQPQDLRKILATVQTIFRVRNRKEKQLKLAVYSVINSSCSRLLTLINNCKISIHTVLCFILLCRLGSILLVLMHQKTTKQHNAKYVRISVIMIMIIM